MVEWARYDFKDVRTEAVWSVEHGYRAHDIFITQCRNYICGSKNGAVKSAVDNIVSTPSCARKEVELLRNLKSDHHEIFPGSFLAPAPALHLVATVHFLVECSETERVRHGTVHPDILAFGRDLVLAMMGHHIGVVASWDTAEAANLPASSAYSAVAPFPL